jgi:hypothetical protein
VHTADGGARQWPAGSGGVGARLHQRAQHRRGAPVGRSADLPHGRVEPLEVDVTQVGQAQVAESGPQVEGGAWPCRVDARSVVLPGQPLVEIPADGQVLFRAQVRAAADGLDCVGQGRVGLRLGVLRAHLLLPPATVRGPWGTPAGAGALRQQEPGREPVGLTPAGAGNLDRVADAVVGPTPRPAENPDPLRADHAAARRAFLLAAST